MPKKKKVKSPIYAIDKINQIVYYIKNNALYLISLKNIKSIGLPNEIKPLYITIGSTGVYVATKKEIYLFSEEKWKLLYILSNYEIDCIFAHQNMDDIYIALNIGWVLKCCFLHDTPHIEHIIYMKKLAKLIVDPIKRSILTYDKRNNINIFVMGELKLYDNLKRCCNIKTIFGEINNGDLGILGHRGTYTDFSGCHDILYTTSNTEKCIVINSNKYYIDQYYQLLYKNKTIICHSTGNLLYYDHKDLYIIKEIKESEDSDKDYSYEVEKLEKCIYCGDYMKYKCPDHIYAYNTLIIAMMARVVYNCITIKSGFAIESIVGRIMSKYL